jgi:hypothetical protein
MSSLQSNIFGLASFIRVEHPPGAGGLAAAAVAWGMPPRELMTASAATSCNTNVSVRR